MDTAKLFITPLAGLNFLYLHIHLYLQQEFKALNCNKFHVCLCVRVGIVVGYSSLFLVVYYNIEDWVMYVCVYVIDV
jgi:hypothetical protein